MTVTVDATKTGTNGLFMQAGDGTVARTVQAKLREWVSADDKGAVGDGATDDTTAVQAALTNHDGVFLTPGKTYLVSSLTLKANNFLFGIGRTSSLKQTGAGKMLLVNSGSSAATVDGISVFNLQLLGTVAADGFSEQVHLASLSGVRDLVFDNVLFKGFRGDGLYLGSGDTGQERHNYDVRVLNCTFDGVNNDNRNGISVIDVDGLLVAGCTFKNCTRSTMPGPIDLEPNANAYHVLKNVTIRDNWLVDNGGNSGEIGIIVPAAVTAVPSNITVENNNSVGYVGTGSFFVMITNRVPTDTSEENDVKVLNNRGRGGRFPVNINDGKRIRVEGNTFSDYTESVLIGFTSGTTGLRDVVFDNNRLIRCGSSGGKGMQICTVDYMRITRNVLDDCGTGNAGSANAIDFNTGTSSYVTFEGNDFVSPTDKTLVAVQKEAGHTFTPTTNKWNKNTLGTLTNNFEAVDSDALETSWTPVVEGASAAGAGTYTVQFGRCRKQGDLFFFEAELDVDAGHTGTGQIEVSLPFNVRSASGGALKAIVLVVDGANTTGGHVGLLNTAAVVNGVTGAVRCWHTATGTLTQTTIPAGAFKIYMSGFAEAA